MKKGLLALIIFVFTLISINYTVNANEEGKVVYFYVETCEVCARTKPYVDSLERFEDYNIVVEKYDRTKYNDKFYDYIATYNVPLEDQSTPILFVGDTYFHGEDIIPNIQNNTIPKLASTELRELIDGQMGEFNLFYLIWFALIDGINPCAMAMLLLFISLLGFTSKRSVLIKVSLSYIFALFLSYFLLGTVLYNVLYLVKGSSIIFYFNILIIVISLLLFIFNMYDYFVTKYEKFEKVIVQLPRVIQKYNKKIIKTFTKKLEEDSPWIYIITFSLGFVISLTEFLCTGQVYLAFITSMIHFSDTLNIASYFYLLLYNFIFVLPLIAIAVMAIKSKSIMGTSDFIRQRMYIIKLLNALLFLVIALYYINYYIQFINYLISTIGYPGFFVLILIILVLFYLFDTILSAFIRNTSQFIKTKPILLIVNASSGLFVALYLLNLNLKWINHYVSTIIVIIIISLTLIIDLIASILFKNKDGEHES